MPTIVIPRLTANHELPHVLGYTPWTTTTLYLSALNRGLEQAADAHVRWALFVLGLMVPK